MSGQPRTTSKVQNMSSGMTPRGLTAGLTPTMNFAMDFGRGSNKKEDGNGALCLCVVCLFQVGYFFTSIFDLT